ncbi:translocation/assembly module TamB domain-containing protein [Lyngbya sp. CCY1209]|uniref:translocation/assembly module TamB domain-containing protein n=1 Tax=Lyngbya sp. CCY1209 TaxID=2886103 RepID=UPI002D21440D|nr:translocation/assembly module TamB domain-containing protein [Lyngbya sp. CCY1209]MEB3885644.1 translocation/assembly module TamB domain-containing protein [Lyngbya sp. CCY1209]
MTNSPNPSTEPTPRPVRRWRRRLIWGGVGLGVTSIAIAGGVSWFVKSRLAPIIAETLEGIIDRPVEVGPVERFGIISIRFGPSAIPPTATNPNTASLEAIEATISIVSLFQPTVLIDLTVIDPEVYLEEDSAGNWIRTQLKQQGESPLQVEIGTIRVENADVKLMPQTLLKAPLREDPVTLEVDRLALDVSDANDRIRGNVSGRFSRGGDFRLKANAVISEGNIEAELDADDLTLPQLALLVQTPGFALEKGDADADLRVKLENFKPTGIWGDLQLEQLQADVEALSEPVRVETGNFRFTGNQAVIRELDAGFGEVAVNVGGTVTTDDEFDFRQTEFDLTANLEPVTFSTLLETVEGQLEEAIALPVPIAGEVEAEIDLTGSLQEPTVSIAIATTAPTQIDRVPFEEISIQLETVAELTDEFNLASAPVVTIDELNIRLATGGEITGSGAIALDGLTEFLAAEPDETGAETAEEFPFDANVELSLNVDRLDGDAIARLFDIPPGLTLGEISANAQLSGEIDDLTGEVVFELPGATYPIFGNAQFNDGRVDGTVRVAEGTVDVNAQLRENNNWNAAIAANQLAVDYLLKFGLPLANLEPDLREKISQLNLEGSKIDFRTNILGSLDNLNLDGIVATGDIIIGIADGSIDSDFRLNERQFGADFNINSLSLPRLLELGLPFVNLSPEIERSLQTLDFRNGAVLARGSIVGNLDNLTANGITADVAGRVDLGNIGGSVSLENARLRNGKFDLKLDANSMALNPFINAGLSVVDLPANVREQVRASDLRNSRLNGEAIASGNLANPSDINSNFNGIINLGNFGGEIVADGQINSGAFKGTVRTNDIPLNPLIELGLPLANLPPDVVAEIRGLDVDNGILRGETSFSGNLATLSPENLNLTLDGQIDLGDDGGSVTATGRVGGGAWTARLAGDRIALGRFSEWAENLTGVRSALGPTGLLDQAENLPLLRGLLDTELTASGSVTQFNRATLEAAAQLRLTELPILRQPFEAAATLREGRVELERAETPQFGADGMFALEFSGTGVPSLGDLNVNVRVSDFDLNSPLVQTALAVLPPEILAGDTPPVWGSVSFQGNVTGPISALNLRGNLRLEDFALRGLEFDPVLAGPVEAGLGEGVNVSLAGEGDRIELVLDDRFLPESFLVQRGDAIARGTSPTQNNLQVSVEDFPLTPLGLAPLAQAGIGPLGGNVSAELAVSDFASFDLSRIDATGEVSVDRPSLGYIEGDRFGIQVSLANGIARLTDGELQQGETVVLISARANVNEILTGVSPADGAEPPLEANITIPQGNLQDLFAALHWYDLEDITRGIQTPLYAGATTLNTVTVGLPETASLTQQLRYWAEIQALLKWEESQKPEGLPLPPLEAVNASFTGEINVSGSPSDITATADIRGEDWTWGPHKTDEFILQASFEDNIVRVLPLRLRSDQTLVGFQGQLDLDRQIPSGQLRVKNLRLEEVEAFYDIPNVDLSGQFNLQALFSGSLENPRATGEFTVIDGLFNGEPLKEARGSFSYNNARLNAGGAVLVTAEDPIRYRATVPFRLPFAKVNPESNFLSAQVEVRDEGFKIINLVNPEVDWVQGKGLVKLGLQGILEQAPDGAIANLVLEPEGELKVLDGVLQARGVEQAIAGLSGTAIFTNNRLWVKGIEGELVGETGTGNILLEGVLPIFEPLRGEDPDLTNPLRLVLDNLKLNLEGLYEGDAQGEIIVRGSALQPAIGGGVAVSEALVTLPQGASPTTGPEGEIVVALEQNPGGGELPDTGPLEVSFDNFTLMLGEGIQVKSASITSIFDAPVLNFNVQGMIVVNGELENLDTIRPSGTIELTGGAVNLYTSRFQLDRGYPQTVTFVPSQGLDPVLNVRLVTRVAETTPAVAPTSAFATEMTEVPSATQFGTVRTIRVFAIAQGSASEINDILELRSSPPRSQTQLLALLGGSAIEGVTGDTALVLANIASAGLFNQIQQSVIDATGLTEFRIYPARVSEESSGATALGLGLEVGFDVRNDVSVSISRVLADDQPTQLNLNYRVNDKLLLRGATNFGNQSEIRFEYETRF